MRVAVIQSAFGKDPKSNVERIEAHVRAAAKDGAEVILPPELFETEYFPRTEDESCFSLAKEADGHPLITRFCRICQELGVVIPVSFFERDGQSYYNAIAIIDASGEVLGIYRKSHIPDGPGYEEKYYFRPGDTGFRVWPTRFGNLGVGICWDQWFPECARAMTLLGAEILLYPTAIGSEPAEPDNDTAKPWRRAMIGHAVCNAIPVAAANRIGNEQGQVFYGTSFICNHRGDLLADLDRQSEGVAIADIDPKSARNYRDAWGFFRDRRPEHYQALVR